MQNGGPLRSFSPTRHKAVLEFLCISNVAQHRGKLSAKGQIDVDVTCEISPPRALLLAALEAVGIYSCSPTDLQTESKYRAFCSNYQEPPSVEMIYCFPASH